MIPIRDTVRSRTFPFTTLLIIAINSWVFMKEVSLRGGVDGFIRAWGLIPSEITRWEALGGNPLDPHRFLPILTSMFIHGGWAHIIGNMIFLWVFGGHVEDRLGHLRFLAFYLLCGSAAAAAQIWSGPLATTPMVGASGAIAGVLGAYFLLFPKAKVLTLIPIFIFPWLVEIPSIVFLGVWFLMQLLSGTAELGMATAQTQGIAWWAHAGGFIAGFILALVLPRRPARKRLVMG